MWEEQDSIVAFGKQLVEAGVCGEGDLKNIEEKVKADMVRNMKLAIDEKISPRIDLFGSEKDYIGNLMFSNETVRSMDTTREPEMLLPKEECPRVKQLKRKKRFGFDETGSPILPRRYTSSETDWQSRSLTSIMKTPPSSLLART